MPAELWQMSLTGGVMIAAVLLARPLLRRWRTYQVLMLLWLCAWALLWLPFRPSSPASVYTVAQTSPALTRILAADYPFAAAASEPPAGQVRRGAPAVRTVWMTGGCLMGAAMLLSLALFRRRFRGAVLREDLSRLIPGAKRGPRVYVSPRAAGPVTYGIFRPRIILPAALAQEGEALEFILLHERQHILHGDALINLLWLCALCVHWFNPLVWLGWVCLRRDLENRCDAAVAGRLDARRRADYAQTLLDMTKTRPGVFPLAFGTSAAGGRIRRVLAYRPVTRRAVGGALALALCCLTLFATKPIGTALAGQLADAAGVSVPADASAGLTGQGYVLYRFRPASGQESDAFAFDTAYQTFASQSELLDYFADAYSEQKAEALAPYLTPVHFQICGFGCDDGFQIFGFSIRRLTIGVETEQGPALYLLVDQATYESNSQPDMAYALNRLPQWVFSPGYAALKAIAFWL